MAIKSLSAIEIATPNLSTHVINKGYVDDNFLLMSKLNGVNITLTDSNNTVSLRFPEYVKTNDPPHTSYKAGDIVWYNSTLWRCVQDTTSEVDFSSSNWSILITRQSGYTSGSFSYSAIPAERENVREGVCSFNHCDFSVGGGGQVSLRHHTWVSSHNDEKQSNGTEGGDHPTSFSCGEKIVYNGALYLLKKEGGLLVNRGSYVASNTYMTDDIVWWRGRYSKCRIDNVKNTPPVSSSRPWKSINPTTWQDISPGADGGEYWELLSTPVETSRSINIDPTTHQLEVATTLQPLVVVEAANQNIYPLWNNKHWICSIDNTINSRNFNLPSPTNIESNEMYTVEMILRCEAKSPPDDGVTIAFRYNNTPITFLGDYPNKFERGYNYFIVLRNFPANVISSGVSEVPDTVEREWVGNVQGRVAIPPASS